MRPLDRLPSIRAKLGSVIVFAVAVTIMIMYLTVGFALRTYEQTRESQALQGEAQTVAALAFTSAGVPSSNLGRVVDRVPNQTSVFDASGRPLVGSYQPPTLDRVLRGYTDFGLAKGHRYAGVPVFRGSALVGAVYVSRRDVGSGIGGAALTTLALLRTVWWQLLAAGAISAFIALALARILARGMTQPIREMAGAAERMATGDYQARVKVHTRDELGRLAGSFNRMAGELEGVERLRRELVANVSHELKTPISALRAHLENLLDGVEEPNPETLQIMLEQSERLTRLVEELLDLSRLEAGDVPLQLEPVGLRALVEQVGREVSVGRGSERPAFRNEVNASVEVNADRERLHQVLFNLLDNAFRFTPGDGSVVASASIRDSTCEVAVEDTGPGIPAEHLPFVFERFYRVSSSRSRDDGGTGIGLAISRSIVEAHGGRIRVEQRPGGGSRFVFEVAVAPPAAGQDGGRRFAEPAQGGVYAGGARVKEEA
jgi:signal transduction histidine kinase